MRMIEVDGHTYDEDLLTYHGWVIDAGCRGFNFSWSLHITNKVYALDIEDFTDTSKELFKNLLGNDVIFKHAALSHKGEEVEAHYFGNGTGNFVKGVNEQPYNGPDRPCETKKVQAITLQDIYDEIGTDIDLLKLDIEGSEYEILASLEPIPKQVSVEFHAHCHEKIDREWTPKVLEHMSENYELKLFSTIPRYPYMDCLFIRKDLL